MVKRFIFPNTKGYLSDPDLMLESGWSEPEEFHTWAIGHSSCLSFLASGINNDCFLSLQISPFTQPNYLDRQSLRVFVNDHLVTTVSVHRRMTVECRVPKHMVRDGDIVRLRLEHPDAACPRDFPSSNNPDCRKLALAYYAMTFAELTAGMQSLSSRIRSALGRNPDNPDIFQREEGGVADSELKRILTQFESIGVDCEFGMLQRRFEASRAGGLFRFSSITIGALIRGLECRFAGIDEERHFTIGAAGDDVSSEYFAFQKRYGIVYHTGLSEKDVPAFKLRRIELKRLKFLAQRLLEDIAAGRYLLVIKRKTPIAIDEIAQLATVIGDIGNSTILWVSEVEFGRPAGSVERLSATLLRGYVDWIDEPPMENPDLASWSKVCVTAHQLWTQAPPPRPAETLHAG